MAQRDAVDRLDHPGRPEQGVPAPIHGHGPGVAFVALDRHHEAALALAAQHHAHRLALGLEDRPLLDMGLEIGRHRVAADGLRAGIADALELPAHGLAVGGGAAQSVVEVVLPGEDPGRHHARGKAHPFLVGPHDHVDRGLGLDPGVVQRAHHLEPGQDSVHAVELSTQGLGIEVASGHHRRQLLVSPGAPGEDVAHAVDAHLAPGFAAPDDEQITRFLIEVGQREPPRPARRSGPDARHRHQTVPQTIAVNV